MWIELFCGVTAIAFVLMVKWVGDLENEIRNLKICKANIKHVDATIRQAHSSACELLENERKARKEENEKINEAIIAEVMERNRSLAASWITCDKETKNKIDSLHNSLFVKDAFGLGFKHLFKFTAVEFERLLNDEHNKLEIVKRYTTPLLAKMHKEELADWKKEVETFRSIGGR